MSFKSVKIGKYTIEVPIIQGGMGVGISLDGLAGNVSKEGGLGTIATVGTGYYKNGEFLIASVNGIPKVEEFNSDIALSAIFKEARKIAPGKPIAANVMVALTTYKDVLKSSCEAGANIIISGAGLPTYLPSIKKDYPNVAIVPIVSNVKVLRILLKRWKGLYKEDIFPDAIVIEGPKSGGHQGVSSIKECFLDKNQLEATIPPLIKWLKENGLDIPVFAAGGIWDKEDIEKFIAMGCVGIQMGTRFLATHESDASDTHKRLLIECTEDDIKVGESPVGYPSRRIVSNIHKFMDEDKNADPKNKNYKRKSPKIICISNCVTACNHGEKAREVGYCIADRLSDAYKGIEETGLFFTGINGYRVKKLISVKELMRELTEGE